MEQAGFRLSDGVDVLLHPATLIHLGASHLITSFFWRILSLITEKLIITNQMYLILHAR